jgi:hypothetical protein
MHPYVSSLLSPAALAGTLPPVPWHAALNAYDREIIRRTWQAIQRSRELLEATKHQVLPSSERSDQGS